MNVHMKLPRRRFLHLAAGVAALPGYERTYPPHWRGT